MKEIFHQAVDELANGDKVVIATVVHTKGSTPQKPGAKLLVKEDGSAVGTLGGGCVEGDIWFAASDLMKRGGPPLFRDYQLNQNLAADEGLICGGTMYFLIDPIYKPGKYMTYASEIDAAYEGGPPVALASLIRMDNGSVATGEKMFVRARGSVEGSFGLDDLDDEVIKKARELMALGRNEYVKKKNGVAYFVEAYTTPPQLVLVGGGHVSNAIAKLASTLGFRIFVTDDREEFANPDRFPSAELTLVDTPGEALAQIPVNQNTFIIVATRGHRYDNVALAAAARTSAKYVGLLGSKRKVILIYEDLIRDGVPLQRVKEIRAPVGLNIHGRTPEEIAVSIMAEILMFRLGGNGVPMLLDEPRIDLIADKINAQGSKTSDT